MILCFFIFSCLQPLAGHAQTRDSVGAMHIGWHDGRIPEYENAYTLRRHEVRLHTFGRSAYGLTNRLEMSSYLLLILSPNVSFKYRFADTRHFAAAYEFGTADGLLPVFVADGLVLPGGAVGGATAGFLTYTDFFGKFYFSYKPSRKFTLSARVGISHISAQYHGVVAFAAIGGGGGGAALAPISADVVKTNWLMAGLEADYVINDRNAIVLKASIGKLYTQKFVSLEVDKSAASALLYPSLSWNHSWVHFHLAAGIYNFYDVPYFRMVKNAKEPFGPYANCSWLVHNRVRG